MNDQSQAENPADLSGNTASPPPPPKRLRRRSDGSLGGVAGGISDFLGIDPVFARIAFCLSALAGVGVLVYIAAWALLPDDTDPDPRQIALTEGLFPLVIGVGALLLTGGIISEGQFFFDGPGFWALLLIGAGFLLLNQRDRTHAAPASAPLTTLSNTPTAPPVDPRAGGLPVNGPLTHSASRSAAISSSAFGAGHTTDTAMGHDPESAPPQHWATPRTETAIVVTPKEPKPPVTSVTLAVAALVVGVLIALNQFTNLDVGAAAVFGSVAAVCGAGLIASSFVGRALPLIPVAFFSTIGLGVAPLVDALAVGGIGPREYAPAAQGELLDDYQLGAGSLELDLRGIDFSEDQRVGFDLGAGYALIRVPQGVSLDLDLTSDFGLVDVLGEEVAGTGNEFVRCYAGAEGEPTLTIVGEVQFGEIEVRRD